MQTINLQLDDTERFGRYLIKTGVISKPDLKRAVEASINTHSSLHLIIESLGIATEDALLSSLSQFCNLPILTRADFPTAPILDDTLDLPFLKRNHILPIKNSTQSAVVAIVNPFDKTLTSALSFHLEKPIKIMLASIRDIDWALETLYTNNNEPIISSIKLSEHDIETLKNLATEQPLIRYVNRLIENAVDLQASDIHIEPEQLGFRTRFRIDGILTLHNERTSLSHAAIASRIKIMAKLNIAERRLPQDGRIRTVVRGNSIDLRVSTTPTFHGESIVLRILDKSSISLDFSSLGYDGSAFDLFQDMLKQPSGIILVTGPTGSGKTTTLYTALKTLNNGQRKIFTVEDPVEYQLPGVNQIPTQPSIGLNFARALRSILRQDPDTIMIGEIRDLETAEIAIQAALTGHLVLATLHTNSSAAAVTRLLDMGVQDFLLSSTLSGVVAQRLVRHLCAECSIDDTQTSKELLKNLYPDITMSERNITLKTSRGCVTCNQTGFRGRSSIFEVMSLTRDIKRAIIDNPDETTLEALSKGAGMKTMLSMGLTKVMAGETTLEEILRVTKAA